MKFIKFILAGATLMCNIALANGPIELIVPFPPGGAAGNLSHVMAEILTENGLPTIVVNKPGADATIGTNFAAEAAPNGKTLFMGSGSTLSANVAFGVTGMKYNEKSFVPIMPLGEVGQVLIVLPNSPIKNYEQFKFYVKANPDKFFLGFWNTNYSKILYAWAEAEGLPRPTIIIYKGSAALELDVMGGQILAGVDPWTTPSQLFAGGKLGVLAGFTNDVISQIKDIDPKNPSVSIAKNHPELAFSVWYGLYAPAGTPMEITTKINTILNAALKHPKWKEKMAKFYLKNYGGNPDKLIEWQQRDLKTLRRIRAQENAENKTGVDK